MILCAIGGGKRFSAALPSVLRTRLRRACGGAVTTRLLRTRLACQSDYSAAMDGTDGSNI